MLRKKYDNDEVRAWRGIGGLRTFVVSPDQYDQHDSLPRETPTPRQVWGTERMTGPNSTISIERTAHAKGRQKSTLIGARSSKQAQKMTRVTKAIGQRGIIKIGANRTGRQAVISIEAGSSRSCRCPPLGPGWESKLVEYQGRNRFHWLSPCRRIEFRRYQPACRFEKLRKENDNDEVRAWDVYGRDPHGRTWVVSPDQYDQHDSLTEDADSVGMDGEEVACPKQGSLAPEVETASLEVDGPLFEVERPEKEKEQADLDRLDKEQLDGDRIMDEMADVQRRMSPKNPPPGPGWTSKKVTEAVGHSCFHWISPIRRIQFTRYKPACRFEKLRKKNDKDEVRAWDEYRRNVCGPTFVASAHLYDSEPWINRATKETAGNMSGTQEIHLTGASARKSPKSPPLGSGWESKLVKFQRQNRLHWLSPSRHIEFRRYKPA